MGLRRAFYRYRRKALASLLRRGIGRGTVNARDLTAHWTNVRAELSAVMNGIEKRGPQQSADRVPEDDFFFSSRQPGRTVPGVVIETNQLFRKQVMMKLVSSNHLFQSARSTRGVK